MQKTSHALLCQKESTTRKQGQYLVDAVPDRFYGLLSQQNRSGTGFGEMRTRTVYPSYDEGVKSPSMAFLRRARAWAR